MTGPPTLRDKAAEDLQYIRRTMDEAGKFTAVPGVGLMLMGATALAAAAIARYDAVDSFRWLAIWLIEAVAAVTIGVISITLKARRAGQPLLTGPAQRFILAFVMPLAAGAILTRIFVRDGLNAQLPGLWLLCYGSAMAAAGTLSVRPVLFMGLVFFGMGAAVLTFPGVSPNVAMAAGFGGAHIAFGLIVARNYGG